MTTWRVALFLLIFVTNVYVSSIIHRIEMIYNLTKDTFQVNVEKVLERDQKLSQLDDRADALQVCFLKCVSSLKIEIK